MTYDISAGIMIGFLYILVIVFACLWIVALNNRTTRKYRRVITDLFVTARIRQEADKHKINLKEEEKNYIKYEKYSTKKMLRDLDEAIELDLMESIDVKDKK